MRYKTRTSGQRFLNNIKLKRWDRRNPFARSNQNYSDAFPRASA
jgi:hypothetical protein